MTVAVIELSERHVHNLCVARQCGTPESGRCVAVTGVALLRTNPAGVAGLDERRAVSHSGHPLLAVPRLLLQVVLDFSFWNLIIIN